jgi:hypothetical protein
MTTRVALVKAVMIRVSMERMGSNGVADAL